MTASENGFKIIILNTRGGSRNLIIDGVKLIYTVPGLLGSAVLSFAPGPGQALGWPCVYRVVRVGATIR